MIHFICLQRNLDPGLWLASLTADCLKTVCDCILQAFIMCLYVTSFWCHAMCYLQFHYLWMLFLSYVFSITLTPCYRIIVFKGRCMLKVASLKVLFQKVWKKVLQRCFCVWIGQGSVRTGLLNKMLLRRTPQVQFPFSNICFAAAPVQVLIVATLYHNERIRNAHSLQWSVTLG